MKLTRNQIVELNYVLRETNWVHDEKSPLKSYFRYILKHNIKVTDAEVEMIKEVFPIPDGYVKFTENQNKIIDKYSKLEIDLHAKYSVEYNKDEDKYDTSGLSDESKEELVKEHTKLKEAYTTDIKANSETYKDILAEFEASEKEKVEFLNEEIEIDIKKGKIEIIPDISAVNKHPHWEIWRVLELIVE